MELRVRWLTWYRCTVPHPSEKRAIAQATVNALGNSASICELGFFSCLYRLGNTCIPFILRAGPGQLVLPYSANSSHYY